MPARTENSLATRALVHLPPGRVTSSRRSATIVFGLLLSSVDPLAHAAATTRSATIDRLDVEAASYLGGSGADTVHASALLADGSSVLGGSWPAWDPPGQPIEVDLLGGGDGALLRLDRSGTAITRVTRLGAAIVDLETLHSGEIALAVADLGTVLLNEQGDQVLWHETTAQPMRVAAGGENTQTVVAELTESGRLRTFDRHGVLIGERTFNDSQVADVAVAPDGGLVVITGFNNRSFNGTPVQIPFLRAYESTLGTLVWRAYDWTASQLAEDQNDSLADSRGVRVAFGEDDQLYFAGRTDGGNNTFRYDPLVVDRLLPSTQFISYDQYSNTAGISGSAAITVFARFAPGSAALDKIQLVLARLSNGNGNTVIPAAIAADRRGRVFLGGRTFASIEDRSAKQLNGQPVGPYQGGEAFLLVVAPDFSAREFWHVFTADGGAQNSTLRTVAVRGDRALWGVSIDNDTARLQTVSAFQQQRDADTSSWFAQRTWLLFRDDFEAGNTDAWAAAAGQQPD